MKLHKFKDLLDRGEITDYTKKPLPNFRRTSKLERETV